MLTHQRITSGQFDRAVSGRARRLAASLRAELAGIPGVALHDRGPELSAIVTFSVAGVNPFALRDRLRERRIHVGALDATVARLDLGSRPVREVARAAPHDYNTEAELDVLVHEVARLARSGG